MCKIKNFMTFSDDLTSYMQKYIIICNVAYKPYTFNFVFSTGHNH